MPALSSGSKARRPTTSWSARMCLPLSISRKRSIASRAANYAFSSAVIAPGGQVGLHSHRGDPTIVYMLSGVLTNHHDDGTTEEFHPGEAFAEYGPRSHWVENKGSAPVRFIVANIHRE